MLDCDVQSFFDKVSRDWLIRSVEHRIGDRRIIRLIAKWLTAGVLEDGRVIETEEGTPQGAVISPLLANIYLHQVYDQWVHQWRQRCAAGDVIVVRYADDSIVGFEHRREAEQFLADLKARLARFGLNLHPDKTRLIEFGRNAIANRRARSLGKPETFDFLGFKHYCATRRDGTGFVLGRKPMAKRMRTKLREIKEQLKATRHDGIDGQGKWLAQVLRGWMAYYAVPMSGSAISAFRHHMIERWHGALDAPQPATSIDVDPNEDDRRPVLANPSHPASVAREAVPRHHPRWEPGALAAPAGICAGAASIGRPYRDPHRGGI